MVQAPTIADKAREYRDLTDQIAELGVASQDDAPAFIGESRAIKKTYATVYSMLDGEPLSWPTKIVMACLTKRDSETGKYLFTNNPAEAPTFEPGTVKCFLHSESSYRQSGILKDAGVERFSCKSAGHPSQYAMEEIAKSKHGKQWKAVQAFLERQEREVDRQERREQTTAMLDMAGKAAGVSPSPLLDVAQCPSCDYTGTAKQVMGHKSATKHGEVAAS